jgi:hypothetical protein
MVFARSKLVLEDNCFIEEPGSVSATLIGPNVKTLYKKMYEAMKTVFSVSDANIQEADYKWGKSEKGDKFKVRWWMHKDMDLFSYLYIRFDLSGQGDEKNGSATIGVRGLLRSEYPQDTVWQRSLFYEMIRTFWHRVFYHRKREEFAEECRHSTILFMNRMKEFFQQLQGSVEISQPAAPAEEPEEPQE